jgi:hypothetical protein
VVTENSDENRTIFGQIQFFGENVKMGNTAWLLWEGWKKGPAFHLEDRLFMIGLK